MRFYCRHHGKDVTADVLYPHDAFLPHPESGWDGNRGPTVREYKLMQISLTTDTWDSEDSEEQRRKRKAIMDKILGKVLEPICAALNSRCNTTIYMGVTDGGQIKGLLMETMRMVRSKVSLSGTSMNFASI